MDIFYIPEIMNGIAPELFHFIRTALILAPPEPAAIEFMKKTKDDGNAFSVFPLQTR